MDDAVYVVRCRDYDEAEGKIGELFGLMGGIERYAAPGEVIVLKANLLQAATPDRAVTTHPAIVSAVGREAKRVGARPIVADSPGTGRPLTEATLRSIYETCGMEAAAREVGIDLNMDTSYRPVSFPSGKLVKHFNAITPILEADGVFNLCKLKTHLFMYMTGAVKNHFGIIPGLEKPGFHAKLSDRDRFADMLLDLAAFVSPRISIMDAVLAMEGEGPGAAGTPREVGLLLGSKNPLALDVVAGHIIGLPRNLNPILNAAARRGLVPNRIEDVELVGARPEELRIADYRLSAVVPNGHGLDHLPPLLRGPIGTLMLRGLSLRPVVAPSKCVGCGICAKSCPERAIALVGAGKRRAKIDSARCIRCYCCHELCPERAIDLKPGLMYRLMNR